MTEHPGSRPQPAGWYEIRVQGRLAPRWGSRFAGMALTAGPEGTTVIAGAIADQAALHGLLRTLGDLGLPLLSVREAHHSPDPTHPTDDTTQGD